MEIEIWLPVVNYPEYEISNFGRVKSTDREVINSRSLKPFIKAGTVLKQNVNRGYNSFSVSVEGNVKRLITHREVAKVFLPNPKNKPCINHKNGIKNDNRVENLEWCTYSENNTHSFRELGRISNMLGRKGVLHPSSKKVKCCTLDILFNSVREAAIALNCDESTIIKVCKGIERYTKGFYFKWV